VPVATTLEDILEALFPCGSVVGAPKVSTMRLIAELESSPRQVYCGAIGFVTPKREAMFNVAIRTLAVDTCTGIAEYGVGGGVTWDSTAEDEYAEAWAKAAVLTEERPHFDLLEDHLRRLAASARYFGFALSPAAARSALNEQVRVASPGVRRVRLLVSERGEVRVESTILAELPPPPVLVVLAATPISRHNRFLFHKTTHRAVYEAHRAANRDAFDVLLWNEEDELTEFTTGNLVVELDSRYWTPHRESGLLDGTLRADLLRRGLIHEHHLTKADLGRASGIWLINSVRGWVPVRLD